ncbi:MAG TPA: YqaJ viral recombinase family protein [Elusimicrobiota bacterium]|nr:YqaJ viral recombinase family protein [Elusimicrobiota bacterium]
MKTLASIGGQPPHPPKNGGERATPGQVLPYPGQPFDGKLGDRTKYLGGSDAAACLGLSRWKSPLAVWAVKTGAVKEEDISELLPVKLGVRLEDAVAELFEEQTGKLVHRVNRTLIHPKYDFIRANIDRKVLKEDAIVECKTTSAWKAKEWDGEEVPREYVIQALHYLAVTGAAKCYVAVLIGNQDFKVKTVERDEKVIDDLIRREVHFWNEFVLKNVPPSAKASDKDTLSTLFPQAEEGKTIEMDSEASAILDTLEGMNKDAASLEAQIAEQENLLRQKLGDAETGLARGWKIRWANTKTRRFDADAFKKEHADLYEQFRKETVARRFLIQKTEIREDLND